MATPAQRILNTAARDVGHAESPLGSNDDGGGLITRINRAWGLIRQPWCNMWSDDVYKRADVDDNGIQSPATWITGSNARRAGYLIDYPIPGCLICWEGRHIGIVRRVWTRTIVDTYEGNSGDRVAERTREQGDAIYIAVPALRQAAVTPPKPIRIWCFEDLQAPRLHPGRWRSKLFAQRAKRKLGGLGRRAQLTKRGGRWRLVLPREHRFNTKSGRDAWRRKAEAQWGRPMRPTTRLIHPKTPSQVVADGLGKTT